MSTSIINLQNTPTIKGISSQSVSFVSNGFTLKGILYTSHNSLKHPAAIVTGAWTTVKEQMPGTYARELAARGFAALAFDFTGWGESEGNPRFVEDPKTKTADIHAAAKFLSELNEVDEAKIFGLGVCASSGYMTEAVSNDPTLKKVALVAPWLHDAKMAEGIYGGADAAAKLIALSEAPNAEQHILLGASATNEKAVMYQAPYYTETHRGLIPAYDNKFSALSWKPWLTYDAQRSADRLTKPMLMVGSTSIALPAGAAAYEKRMKAPLEKLWLGDDVSQFDFYDRKDVVKKASDKVAAFFNS